MNRQRLLMLVALGALIAGLVGILVSAGGGAGSAAGEDQMTMIDSPRLLDGPDTYKPSERPTTTADHSVITGPPVPPPPSTTTTLKPKPKPKPTTPSTTRVPVPRPAPGMETFLECVAQYESGRNDASHTSSGSGGYYGILVSSWRAYGGAGSLPYSPHASHAEQHRIAVAIYQDNGPRAWSTRHRCGA